MSTPRKKRARRRPELTDSPEDQQRLQPDEGTLDLPDVTDIPGQEHIRPLISGELADTTISSADEEGEGIFQEEGEDIVEPYDPNVSKVEKELLTDSSVSMASRDDQSLKKAKVDSVDDEGTPLNEEVNQSGSDLDVPGSELDDELEDKGEGDEENNSYSLNDDKEDEINTRV